MEKGKSVLSVKLHKYTDRNLKFEVNGSIYITNLTDGVATVALYTMGPDTYIIKTTYASNDRTYSGTNIRSVTIK